jgi:hypothetical protein
MHARLTLLAEKAIGVVEAAIDGGDLKASLTVLRGTGLLNGEPPSYGSDDADDLEAEASQKAFFVSVHGMGN